MKLKYLLIFVVILFIVGLGHGVFIVFQDQIKQEVDDNILDTSDWKIYTDDEYGFNFRYPSAWGDVVIDRELEGFDQGFRAGIHFNGEPRLWMQLFSDDFSEGVGEGTPRYYDPLVVRNDINTLYEQLGFLSHEEVVLDGKQGLVAIGNRGYAGYTASISYLVPYFLDHVQPRNLFAVIELDHREDAFLVEEVMILRTQPKNQQLEQQLRKILDSFSESN